MDSRIAAIGTEIDSVDVQIGPQFLNLFSEHLYSSPNKAFEELAANSWDAGARWVYIHVPDDLRRPDAAIWVLDDGVSMDVNGFRALWSVATSPKRHGADIGRRQPIGKFGVGKLATYLLAHELTYICRAHDGVVRAITMDYRRINDHDRSRLHIERVPLLVRQLGDAELHDLLASLPEADKLRHLAVDGMPSPGQDPEFEDEFGGLEPEPEATSGTWTLAVLSSLKETGRRLQAGWIRRLLRTALPLGRSITIVFNDERLSSAKARVDVDQEWVLGPGLNLGSLIVPNEQEVEVEERHEPYPCLHVPGLGPVSGRVRLYKDRISGGKSENIEASNGFFVNVRGRVIKPEDPYFGLENLSHTVWAQFRATVRADGLDEQLAVNREAILESEQLRLMRALLMKLFNKARTQHGSEIAASWTDAARVLTDSYGSLPFQPLRRVLRDSAERGEVQHDFIVVPQDEDLETIASAFTRDLDSDPGEIIKEIDIEPLDREARLVRYDVVGRRVVVNRNHPFSEEYAQTGEQLRMLRDIALVDLLTESYMDADLGITPERLEEISTYRDRIFRLVALLRRRSAPQIASLLHAASRHAKGFERIVGDAIEHLGFDVQRLGEPGQPEGVATAIVTRGENDSHVAYSFTYDAKSSIRGKSKTHNVGIAGLVRHRRDHNADHILVVAPDFEQGALEKECAEHSVAPMRADDLARLVMITAGCGPLSLVEFRDVFQLHSPDDVSAWVEGLVQRCQSRDHLPLNVIVDALEQLYRDNPERPDTLDCSLIAEKCRAILRNSRYPSWSQVADAIRGISLMAPSVISIAKRDVFLTTAPGKIAEAIARQLQLVPNHLRYGLARDNRPVPL